MLELGAMPARINEDLLDLLRGAEPATIGHFMHTGFMAPEIRALFPDIRIAGTAITVSAAGADGVMVHHAVGEARPGDVLVIDRCGDLRHACVGGAVAYAARKAGIAGIVVDGFVTDIAELRSYGVPVWARGLSAVTTKILGLGGSFCLPVACGGVCVRPGDAIFADENGVLVLAPHDIAWSAKRAIEMQREEKSTLARIDRGERYADIIGSAEVIRRQLAAK